MTCDLCTKNEATVHLTEIINDQSRELHLCESCAKEKGTAAGQQFGLGELLAGLAEFGPKLEAEAKLKPVCPKCGMTYDDFRKTGRLGCGTCYEAFRKFLAPLLKRIHGSTKHEGRQPIFMKAKTAAASKEDVNTLKERLKAAVTAESFEEAIHLRDQIRALEIKPKKKKSGK